MKKDKKKKKIKHTEPSITCLGPSIENIHIEIVAVEDDNSVMIRLSGFDEFDNVVDYSEYLASYLPLLLYQTEVVH